MPNGKGGRAAASGGGDLRVVNKIRAGSACLRTRDDRCLPSRKRAGHYQRGGGNASVAVSARCRRRNDINRRPRTSPPRKGGWRGRHLHGGWATVELSAQQGAAQRYGPQEGDALAESHHGCVAETATSFRNRRGQRGLDRPSPAARLRRDRTHDGGRLQVRPLARPRPDAAAALTAQAAWRVASSP